MPWPGDQTVPGRGFVASGALPVEEIAATAAAAERLGYSTFWVTVLAGKTMPEVAMTEALAATATIEVGLGLLPLDGFPGAEAGDRLARVPGASTRAIVGLGVGRHHRGAGAFFAGQARAFRRSAPELRVAVGSYGPRVLRVGGELCDAILLNWMTPERVRWAVGHADAGAAAADRPPPRPVYVYVSGATGVGAQERIDQALKGFRAFDYHRRHQDAMRATATIGVVADSPADIVAPLAAYRASIPVINPVGAMTKAERDEVLRIFSPAGQ
jgi:alkanesulfonate monooxygenase SsuD/methylene tetrahydromethanopterin reductase-like flavin-dependent oxidoreductase (luciferase family)